MRYLTAKAIVLRRTDYGEADRIITLLTDEPGKIQVIAKGVRRQKSKLAGGIELFSISEIQYIKGKSDIGTLVSTRMQVHFGTIVHDFERTELAYMMLKTINRMIEEQSGSEYFVLLQQSLAALDSVKVPTILCELSFLVRLLYALGHMPDFSVGKSGDKLSESPRYAFEAEAMTFAVHPEGAYDRNHLKVLNLLTHNTPQAMAAVQGIVGYCQDLLPIIKQLQAQFISFQK